MNKNKIIDLFNASVGVCFLIILTSINQGQTQTDTENINPNQPINELDDVGWNEWKRWDNFPHDRIQMGMSNMDYSGLMDTEYACFGSVGEKNKAKKSRFYWYRLGEKQEMVGTDLLVEIEVGCWIDNQFKARFPVRGIVLKPLDNDQTQN